MKTYRIKYLSIICCLLLFTQCEYQTPLDEPVVINYLNETTPVNTPKVFGSGIVSIDDKNTHACMFSPDGSMLVFSRYPDGKSYIMTLENGIWSAPFEAFFHGKECSFSADGEKIFYYSNDGDIFFNEKTQNSWGNPISVGSNINTSETEYYPSITNDGTLFFSRAGKWSDGRIFYSTFENGQYSKPVDIGLPVNTGGALHAYVAKDKSYMLFNSPRTGSFTQLDIWISFHKEDGFWSEPQNLGETINSGADAILCPTVSPDGKYMFFTRLNFNPQCGYVYWVSTDFINELKNPTNSIIQIFEQNIQVYPNPAKDYLFIQNPEKCFNKKFLEACLGVPLSCP